VAEARTLNLTNLGRSRVAWEIVTLSHPQWNRQRARDISASPSGMERTSKYFRTSFHCSETISTKLPSVCEILPSGISRLAPHHWNGRSSENIHFEFSMEMILLGRLPYHQDHCLAQKILESISVPPEAHTEAHAQAPDIMPPSHGNIKTFPLFQYTINELSILEQWKSLLCFLPLFIGPIPPS
jgi:hypothetical protein